METIKYFFSYSRQNAEFVIRLAADLKDKGIDVWVDQTNISAGSRWDESIENALKQSNSLIVVLSTAAVQSQNVMDEISYAISNGKGIVPIMIENCTVPFRLARFQYIDFTGNYTTGFHQLLNTLHAEQDITTNGPASQGNLTGDKSQKKKKPHSDNTGPLSERQEAKNSAKSLVHANLAKLTGLLLIVLAVIITLVNKCPTNVQYFIIYALTGIGIALLLAKSAEKSSANVTMLNVGIALGGGVALPFILFFTNPIGSFKPDDCHLQLSYTGTTVFIHGKKSKQDMILRQKGFVIMDVNGERKRASINENGQAFFQNLHVGDSVRIEIDFSEPYKAINPDTVYVIDRNGNIYLPVALQGIDKVHGKVLYDEAPLAGVIVEINDLTDTTDGTGKFNIAIPEAQQTKEYKVWFSKQGFKTKSAPAFPQTGEPLNIVMEK